MVFLRFHVLYVRPCCVTRTAQPPLSDALHGGPVACEAVSVRCSSVADTCLLTLAKMPFVFSHVEYCDMHFVYGFCNGNALAAVEEYRRRFPDRRTPSRRVFTRIHQTLRDTGCLPSVAVRSEREVIGTIDTRENILEMVQRSLRLSTRRMAFRIRASRMQVWRTSTSGTVRRHFIHR